jgi:hypothetical protein
LFHTSRPKDKDKDEDEDEDEDEQVINENDRYA